MQVTQVFPTASDGKNLSSDHRPTYLFCRLIRGIRKSCHKYIAGDCLAQRLPDEIPPSSSNPTGAHRDVDESDGINCPQRMAMRVTEEAK